MRARYARAYALPQQRVVRLLIHVGQARRCKACNEGWAMQVVVGKVKYGVHANVRGGKATYDRSSECREFRKA